MPDPELEKAWADVHENTPDGWHVGRAMWDETHQPWAMYTIDPSEKPKGRGPSREWTAVGVSELDVVRDMALCLGELKAARCGLSFPCPTT